MIARYPVNSHAETQRRRGFIPSAPASLRLCVGLILSSSTMGIAGLDPSGLAKMDAAIERAIERKKCPGGVLWFEHRGETYTKHFGRRAVEPEEEKMTADTVFDAASLTKVVATTTCVMKLVEVGKLSLDDKVQQWVPEFTGDANKPVVEVRDLMTHTSGLAPIVKRGYDYTGYGLGVALACGEPSWGHAKGGSRITIQLSLGFFNEYCVCFRLIGTILRCHV